MEWQSRMFKEENQNNLMQIDLLNYKTFCAHVTSNEFAECILRGIKYWITLALYHRCALKNHSQGFFCTEYNPSTQKQCVHAKNQQELCTLMSATMFFENEFQIHMPQGGEHRHHHGCSVTTKKMLMVKINIHFKYIIM